MDRNRKNKSELEALLIDSEEADIDKRLREVLEGKVAFDRTSGRLVVRPGLFALGQRERVLVLLLGRHALVRLGLPDACLEVDPAVLAEQAQVPLKNCREYLSRLKSKRIVEKKARGYALPTWNILLIADELKTPIKE